MMTAPDVADLIAQLQTGLRQAAARARELGATAVETKLVEGVAWPEIVAAAKTQGCDLIVMGTQGRSGLSHLLLGSVAEKVVRHAPCPVMAVHKPR